MTPWRELTSDERAEAVRALVEPPVGLTFAEAAKKLGAPSREAVAGVVHRNGIRNANQLRTVPHSNVRKHPPRPKTAAPQIVQEKARRARAAALTPPATPPIEPEPAAPLRNAWRPIHGYATIEDHLDGGCRWPVDTPAGAIAFCNGPVTAEGRPWCAAHDAMAWRAPGPVRMRPETPRQRTFDDIPT